MGRYNDALESYKRSRIIGEWLVRTPRIKPSALRILANVHNKIGDLSARTTGGITGARESYRQALQTVKALENQGFLRTIFCRRVGGDSGGVGGAGYLPLNIPSRRARSTDFTNAIELAQRWVRSDPTNVNAAIVLSGAYVRQAWSLRKTDPARSLEFARAAIDRRKVGASESYPYMSNMTGIRLTSALILQQQGQRTEAIRELQATAVELMQLAHVDPENTSPQLLAIEALVQLAKQYLAESRYDKARSSAESARVMGERLYSAHRADLRMTAELSMVYEVLGELAQKERDLPQARSWFEKNVALWTAWPELGTSSSYDRERARLASEAFTEMTRDSKR